LSLLSLFPQYSSNLDNIFLKQLYNCQDHKKLDNKILSHIVDQIIDLSINEITINISNKQKILFRLIFIVGDNLCLNTILGFFTGFKT